MYAAVQSGMSYPKQVIQNLEKDTTEYLIEAFPISLFMHAVTAVQ